MDQRLIERTVEIASPTQEFGSRALRPALDSSPLWGAGRVEDTYNLIGHALKKIMRVLANQKGQEVTEVAKEAGAELVCDTSLKAALDRDWDQQLQKDDALSSTISASWLVPSRSKLIFRMPLDFLTGALAPLYHSSRNHTEVTMYRALYTST